MPRRARLVLPNVPLHLSQRGHDRHACFFADEYYRCYLHWLERSAVRYGCTVHAYVLMTNHIHMVLSAARQATYRELFRHELEPGLVDQIRHATNGNHALGNERFAAHVAAALGRRATPGVGGRPRKIAPPITGDLFP
jgi:hypothetical protein